MSWRPLHYVAELSDDGEAGGEKVLGVFWEGRDDGRSRYFTTLRYYRLGKTLLCLWFVIL